MSNADQYQVRASRYADELRKLKIPGPAPMGITESAPGTSTIETIAGVSEKLTQTLGRAGELTGDILDNGNLAEQEAAELRLLAQAASGIKLARGLLQAAPSDGKPSGLGLTTSADEVDINASIEEIADLLETPLGAELATPQVMSLQGRPEDFAAAKDDLKNETERTLRTIAKRASLTSAHAVQALVAIDPEILKKGLAGFSEDAAGLVDRIVHTANRAVRRVIESATRLLLQAHDWILKILGKDLEGKARNQIKDWLDKWIKGDDGQTFAERLITTVFALKTIRSESEAWLRDTSAQLSAIHLAADSVQGLADKYKTKADFVEKLLKGISLLKLVPIVNTPQIQIIIAAVTACLLGYTVYTGYDHVDSGRVVFLQRFGVEIPDRVQGVRATLRAALAPASAA